MRADIPVLLYFYVLPALIFAGACWCVYWQPCWCR